MNDNQRKRLKAKGTSVTSKSVTSKLNEWRSEQIPIPVPTEYYCKCNLCDYEQVISLISKNSRIFKNCPNCFAPVEIVIEEGKLKEVKNER